MTKKKYNLLSAVLFLTILSCGSGGDEGEVQAPTTPMQIAAPEAASLIFPENNTECNISVVLSATQSTVPFEWNASENTDTYAITVTNLNTNLIVTTAIVGIPEANITLERGTPYEWSVISRATNTNATATSAVFRFFNEGPGIENFAPFPAEVISPNRGENLEASTANVVLQWQTIDIDDDDLEFEILLGTDLNALVSIGTLIETSFEVSTESGQTYFWRVISTDSQNNSSQSEIFSFRVL